ncbi:MAG: hypothetical protein CVV42_11285 [Candidatus Riflebacteria bacterium HGW-Riflebacteria-2]|jgi:hypothetical protein|nr:MAG: hypothetical protein CVV42_11285 [Candidatus Riflebacteria bacterium HGW-Riflebacteria-2]
MNRRSGLTVWEIVLFTVFLAIAGGASVFFFFLNSEDVQYAQRKYELVQHINTVLDAICLEISNSAQFEHPFNGSSRECFFRAAVDAGTLLPDASREGFSFVDNNLVYVSRSGDSTSSLRRLGSFENPLVSNCREGKFTRISSDLLEIRFVAHASGFMKGSREFVRLINLRNR